MLVFDKIFKRGIPESLPFEKSYRIELLNKLIIYTSLCMVIGTLYRIFSGEYFFATGTAIFTILVFLIYFFNTVNYHEKAMHSFVILVNIFMFFSCWLAGMNSGIYLLYFTIITGYALVLDYYKQKQFLGYITISLFFFFILYADSKFHFLPPVTYINTDEQRVMFTIVSFITVALFTYLVMIERYTFHVYEQKQIVEANNRKQDLDIALKEKDILLAEVYHRVKNNLSVVSSMLSLQLNTVENEYTRNILLDSKNRIASMAMIHQHFYERNDFSKIDIRSYIESLLRELNAVFKKEGQTINMHVDIPKSIHLDLNAAIPIGIILNEIVTNAFKHAFKNRDTGNLYIHSSQSNHTIHLSVKDDGVGFDINRPKTEFKSLGLILIEALADQLDGSYTFNNENGTRFELYFDVNVVNEKQ